MWSIMYYFWKQIYLLLLWYQSITKMLKNKWNKGFFLSLAWCRFYRKFWKGGRVIQIQIKLLFVVKFLLNFVFESRKWYTLRNYQAGHNLKCCPLGSYYLNKQHVVSLFFDLESACISMTLVLEAIYLYLLLHFWTPLSCLCW